jgi:cell division protein FtsI (penicillin-binding protein 3)
VLYTAIIKPKGENYGGRIAAPAIREAAELLIDYLGIPRGRNSMTDHSGTFSIPSETLPEIGSTVPRFFGLSKKTLLPLLDRRDISVEIRGDGWVKRQAPPPGTDLTPGMMIILELE